LCVDTDKVIPAFHSEITKRAALLIGFGTIRRRLLFSVVSIFGSFYLARDITDRAMRFSFPATRCHGFLIATPSGRY
jgi:hypothetical protein